MWNRHSKHLGDHAFRWLALMLTALAQMSGRAPFDAQDVGRGSDLRLKVYGPEEQYEDGSLVTLRIEFQNSSTRQIKLGFALQAETGENLSVRLEIRDSDGNKFPGTVQYQLSPCGRHAGKDLLV